jgi:RNA polymerase sigma factor (sigma-70 family)
MALIRAAQSFHGEKGKFSTWATIIIQRQLWQDVQREYNNQHSDTVDSGEISLASYIKDESASTTPEAAEVWEMLKFLPEKQATIIRLRIADYMTWRQIGERVGMSYQGALNMYHDGMRKMSVLASK